MILQSYLEFKCKLIGLFNLNWKDRYRLTFGRTGGWIPFLPHKVFPSFLLEDKKSVPYVFISCSFIPRAHFETSLVMVSCYGYEIWRHKQQVVIHFGWKYMFFQLLSAIKVNLVAKIMQNAYLCVIFHVKNKKLPFLEVLTWFLILGKIQDGGQDGDYCWWRHHPYNIPHLVKKIKSFPLKVKSFQNTATYQKRWGGGSIHTPPPPALVPRWGYEFACTS